MVGWFEGARYVASLGRPTDIGLQLGVGGWVVRRCHVSFVTRGVQLILAYSWARPAMLVAGKGREVMFLFLLFLHFHSCFSFFPVPPFHLFCYLFCLFSPFLWRRHKMTHKGWCVVKPQLNQSYSWARPVIFVMGKGRGGICLFLLFLHFHSCSSFFLVPLFYLFYYLFYLFSPFLWETTQKDPQGLTWR